MEDVNCAPRSGVIFAGTPNLEIQLEMRALAQSASRDGGQRNSLRPTEGLVEDGEEVDESPVAW